jgi:hypothetical protein
VGVNEQLVVVLFAEDRAHVMLVVTLSDRVLCESAPGRPGWVEPETVKYLRTWRGVEHAAEYTPLTKLKEIARQLGVGRTHGKFHGEPGAADAAMIRKALRIAEAACAGCDLVVIARDMDRARTRLGFKQAVASESWPFAVVLAGPEPEAEAWFLAGYSPQGDAEKEALEAVVQSLGFDPTSTPHLLTSTTTDSPKDAKAVLHRLMGNDHARRAQCLLAPLDLLASRGEHCGLRQFLTDVREHMLPLLIGFSG